MGLLDKLKGLFGGGKAEGDAPQAPPPTDAPGSPGAPPPPAPESPPPPGDRPTYNA